MHAWIYWLGVAIAIILFAGSLLVLLSEWRDERRFREMLRRKYGATR